MLYRAERGTVRVSPLSNNGVEAPAREPVYDNVLSNATKQITREKERERDRAVRSLLGTRCCIYTDFITIRILSEV